MFLKTLDSERMEAAENYIALRERLERFFEWRGCENVEGLTDTVFDRVIKKINDGEIIENAEAYCVSVAKFVLMENRREVLKTEELDANLSKTISADERNDQIESEKRFECLDKCLAEFPENKRDLIVSYFDTDEKTMIASRKTLAEKVGLNLNSLRIRISRLKTQLEKCTKNCCAESQVL